MIDPVITSIDLARRKSNMTVTALASASRTARPTLHEYLAGRKQPSLSAARRICEAVGLDLQVVRTPHSGES